MSSTRERSEDTKTVLLRSTSTSLDPKAHTETFTEPSCSNSYSVHTMRNFVACNQTSKASAGIGATCSEGSVSSCLGPNVEEKNIFPYLRNQESETCTSSSGVCDLSSDSSRLTTSKVAKLLGPQMVPPTNLNADESTTVDRNVGLPVSTALDAVSTSSLEASAVLSSTSTECGTFSQWGNAGSHELEPTESVNKEGKICVDSDNHNGTIPENKTSGSSESHRLGSSESHTLDTSESHTLGSSESHTLDTSEFHSSGSSGSQKLRTSDVLGSSISESGKSSSLESQDLVNSESSIFDCSQTHISANSGRQPLSILGSKTLGTWEAQTSGSSEAQTSGSSEAQTSGRLDTQTSGRLDTQKPGSSGTEALPSVKTQTLVNLESSKPNSEVSIALKRFKESKVDASGSAKAVTGLNVAQAVEAICEPAKVPTGDVGSYLVDKEDTSGLHSKGFSQKFDKKGPEESRSDKEYKQSSSEPFGLSGDIGRSFDEAAKPQSTDVDSMLCSDNNSVFSVESLSGVKKKKKNRKTVFENEPAKSTAHARCGVDMEVPLSKTLYESAPRTGAVTDAGYGQESKIDAALCAALSRTVFETEAKPSKADYRAADSPELEVPKKVARLDRSRYCLFSQPCIKSKSSCDVANDLPSAAGHPVIVLEKSFHSRFKSGSPRFASKESPRVHEKMEFVNDPKSSATDAKWNSPSQVAASSTVYESKPAKSVAHTSASKCLSDEGTDGTSEEEDAKPLNRIAQMKAAFEVAKKRPPTTRERVHSGTSRVS